MSLAITKSNTSHGCFYNRGDEKLIDTAAKVVDNLIIAGGDDNNKVFNIHFNTKFNLGKVASGFRRLRFFWINNTRKKHLTIIDIKDGKYVLDDDKLSWTRGRI